MRAGGTSSQTRVWRGLVAPLGAAWRRRGLGRPLAAGLGLLLIGGAVTTVRSLLDLGDGAISGSRHGWPTAVAGGLAGPGFSPVLVLPEGGEQHSDDEVAAALAYLKEGSFGVTFEAAPAAPSSDAAAAAAPPAAAAAAAPPAAAEARFAPVVLIPVVQIDAARPPLRLDIMGLGDARLDGARVGRHRAAGPETAP